jgi:hypothetical protein
MDRRDEDQILAEVRGEVLVLKDFVYEISTEHGPVRNLSYAGVKEIARRRGGFDLLDIKTEETETEIRAIVKIRDLENEFTVLGASVADKSKPFAYVLAHNKAERNALMKLIPAKWFSVLIGEWLERQKTQPSNQPRNITPPSPQVTGENRSQPAQPDKYLGIPATTEAPPPGSNYRQFPLMTEAGISVGVLNISPKNDEVAIVPKGKVLTDDPAVKGFLVPRVLGPLEAKYGFRYSLFADQGILQSIHIKATDKPLEDTQIKELAHAARWAFSKASERTGEAAKK